MVSFEYTIKDPMGLHARPATVMVKRLKTLGCSVKISCGSRSADAQKLLALMGMAVKCGETVTVEIEGQDEDNVKNELMKFFAENY